MRARSSSSFALLALLALLALAPALRAQEATPQHDGVDATLWVQQSAEYRACALQAYNVATANLRLALADKAWTASLEQRAKGNFAMLPPAVILDADETAIDNSAYQAQLIRTGGAYSPEGWQAWVDTAAAAAVPGAVEFCQAARRAGVAVFFVTNRKVSELDGTTRNLQRLGFPVSEGSILPRVDVKDKGPRRAKIAERHRIIMLCGDNAADFASGYDEGGNEQRRGLAADHMDLWGTKWIVIPNPMYGKWFDNLVPAGTPAADREKAKQANLQGTAAPAAATPTAPATTPPPATGQAPATPTTQAPGLSGSVPQTPGTQQAPQQ